MLSPAALLTIAIAVPRMCAEERWSVMPGSFSLNRFRQFNIGPPCGLRYVINDSSKVSKLTLAKWTKANTTRVALPQESFPFTPGFSPVEWELTLFRNRFNGRRFARR